MDDPGGNATQDGRTDPVLARFLVNSRIQQLNADDPRGPHALAEAAGVSAATWKRWTSGKNVEWRQPQVIAAMSALGFDYKHQITQDLIRLAADARKNNVVARPEWLRSTAFDLGVAIEQVCERVSNYELTLVPGLLQTEEYARAVYLSAGYVDDDILRERVQVRVDRQRILHREAGPVQFSAVVDEAVLHRAPPEADVMRGQLARLLELAQLPNVSIQVVPFSLGPYLTDGNGPFVLLQSDRVGRQITYVETSVAATYIETPEANARYTQAWQRLSERALGPKESIAMIRGLLTSSTPR